MTSKLWKYKPIPSEEAIKELSDKINVNPDLATLLLQRGINTFEEAKSYFRAGLEALHDPFLMKNMQKAAERLLLAVQRKEKILFYGDYDVDGTTSVAMCVTFMRQFYPNVDFYVPDRYIEGYGVSQRGIEFAHSEGFNLLITLDCGIKAHDKVDWCNEHQIDVIICDHHQPSPQVPQAIAVLDPKQTDCQYPYKELTGCGVGFKLLQAYCILSKTPTTYLFDLLDFVAISIAADIVPITGENRILVRKGLEIINQNPRVGVKALIDVSGFKKQLDVTNIVFGIAPRINAAGRIGHANQAVKLLISESQSEAEEYAKAVDQKNGLRKDYDQSITQEALQMIEEQGLQKAKSTVLYKHDWHKGVIGIVASRCIEKYYRPTIILTESNGKITGSARSVSGFDIHEAIASCKELLHQFGGHSHAAGLTMPFENLVAFQQKFEEVVAAKISTELLIPKIDIDLKIRLDRINDKFYQIVQQMSPFGPENMQPVFASSPVIVVENSIRVMKEVHLKFLVKHPDNNFTIEALAFGMAEEWLELLNEKQALEICYYLSENDFNGKKTLQIMIKDLRTIE
ncbi:MAG: single-stranded-DNA-specific exonuclease RecJ [Flammeovirgaceae bacterium]